MDCEGKMAVEVKHRSSTRVNDLNPIVMIVMRDGVYKKTFAALKEIKENGVQPIVICEKGDTETQELASKFLEVPKTVDCLQVGFEGSFKSRQIHAKFFSLFSGYFDCHSNATAGVSHR